MCGVRRMDMIVTFCDKIILLFLDLNIDRWRNNIYRLLMLLKLMLWQNFVL
jgi:hypothetical protein